MIENKQPMFALVDSDENVKCLSNTLCKSRKMMSLRLYDAIMKRRKPIVIDFEISDVENIK